MARSNCRIARSNAHVGAKASRRRSSACKGPSRATLSSFSRVLAPQKNIYKISFYGGQLRSVAGRQFHDFGHPVSKLDGRRGSHVAALAWISFAQGQARKSRFGRLIRLGFVFHAAGCGRTAKENGVGWCHIRPRHDVPKRVVPLSSKMSICGCCSASNRKKVSPSNQGRGCPIDGFLTATLAYAASLPCQARSPDDLIDAMP